MINYSIVMRSVNAILYLAVASRSAQAAVLKAIREGGGVENSTPEGGNASGGPAEY